MRQGTEGGPPIADVAIWRVSGRPTVRLPAYMTAGASGCDLVAALEAPLEIAPGERSLVPTGLALAVPPGFEGQVRPRSGLAIEKGLTVLNAPGTIDSDYRGEVQVVMVNLGRDSVRIQPGDRIAQLVIAPIVHARWTECDPADAEARLATQRGSGGFGHTGVSARSGAEAPKGPKRR